MKKTQQLVVAVVMVCFGIALIIAAFVVPPLGYIDPTVLTAYGETLTFAGAVIGIHYVSNNKRGGNSPQVRNN